MELYRLVLNPFFVSNIIHGKFLINFPIPNLSLISDSLFKFSFRKREFQTWSTLSDRRHETSVVSTFTLQSACNLIFAVVILVCLSLFFWADSLSRAVSYWNKGFLPLAIRVKSIKRGDMHFVPHFCLFLLFQPVDLFKFLLLCVWEKSPSLQSLQTPKLLDIYPHFWFEILMGIGGTLCLHKLLWRLRDEVLRDFIFHGKSLFIFSENESV